MKKSIIDIERTFSENLSALAEAAWPESRLVRLANLSRWIHTHLPTDQQAAYRLDLIPHLTRVVEKLASIPTPNLHPRYFLSLLELIGENKTTEETRYQQQLLDAHLYCLYQSLNEADRATELVPLLLPEAAKPALPEHPQEQRDYLHTHASDAITKILTRTQAVPQFASGSRTIQGLFVLYDQDLAVGKRAEVTLSSVKLTQTQGIDQIRISSHLVDEQDVLADQTRALCDYYRKEGLLPEGYYLRAEYSLNQPASLLKGNSVGAALGLITVDPLRNYKRNAAIEQRIYRDVGITGALDEQGNILPVEARTIPHKVAAAFFSPLRTVVLSAEQLSLAQNHVTKLQEEFPRRALELIPAGSMDQLQDNRQVVTYQRRKVTHRVRQFVNDYANSVTLIILGFIVLIALGFWYGVVKHPVPETTIFEEDHVVVKNRFGYPLWESEIGGFRGLVEDLDNDGKKEVLIGFTCNKNSVYSDGRVICYDESGEEKWHKSLGMEVIYGKNTYPNTYSIYRMNVEDLDGDGIKEIVCVASHVFFPTRVVILTYKGKITGDYWNSGNLLDIEAHDIYPGNHTKEILVAGGNNENGRGILFVLDPFRSSGASPQSKFYYTKKSNNIGHEIYYITFPQTHFRRLHSESENRDVMGDIEIVGNDIVEISLYPPITQSGEKQAIKAIYYALSANMQVKFIDLYDRYYDFYRREFPDRKPLSYNDPEMIEYFRQVDYWDGEKWVKEAVMNRDYSR